MIICSCRNIRESDFADKDKLILRLYEDDAMCKVCLENIDRYKSKPNTFMGAWAYYSLNKEGM